MKVQALSPELVKQFRNGVYEYATKNQLIVVTAVIGGVRFFALCEEIEHLNAERQIKEYARENAVKAYKYGSSIILMKDPEDLNIKDILDL